VTFGLLSFCLPTDCLQREEKFFSNAVTHVVTTRQIPSELTNTPEGDQSASKRDDTHGRAVQAGVLSHDLRKTTSLLDASLQRRVQTQGGHVALDAESRRGQAHAADILTKARELGIKIWALEKLQRVLSTMLQADTGEQGATQDTRPTTATRATVKPAKADLEQLLRNEKINGPADRDMTVAAQDMVTFRGCYIYVHDMDERTKPVMARDYNKPATKEQGKWPQFRLTGPGRCPFIEDPGHTKRLIEQERKAADDKAQQEIAATRRTRATAAMEENPRDLRRSPRKLAHPNDTAKPLDPPKVIPAKRPHDQTTAHASTEDVQMPPLFGSAQVSRRGVPRMVGGEPVASGLQHSNVTSAIRSQIVSSNISSTAPGFNRRIPDSKEVSALKRKVLERGASNNLNSAQSVPSSFMNDMRAAINDDQQGPPPRAAKRRAQETLGVVHEGNENGAADPKRRKAAPKKKTEKEPKPGYCENCRDKFDDFDSVCS
jgi:regulatory subunit for Cdc7p protein kinase